MESLTSKVAYLAGFIDGLELDKTTKEGKAIEQIIEVLKDMALEIEGISENQMDIEDYLGELDEDLAYVEDDLFDIDEDEDDDDDDDLDDFIEMKCGSCGEVIYVDSVIVDDGEDMLCPRCHEPLEFGDSDIEEE
jgi:formylmethanofuran dehydrogenase subunit E